MGVHSAPGWSGKAICSFLRVGEVRNFVQFIVSMEWIRFRCTKAERSKQGRVTGKFDPIQLSLASVNSEGACAPSWNFPCPCNAGESPMPRTVRKRISKSERKVRVRE